MDLYARIKLKREQLGMSQDELARILGYKDRSAIAKIESGINDITQSKIMAFAQALNTTPAYLMGWTDEKPATVSDDELLNAISKDDRKLKLVKWIATLDDQGLDRFERILDIVDPPVKE